MDVGLLVVRIVVGLLFVGHGTQKLFGWFGGYGVEGTTGIMKQMGFRPAKAAAVSGGLAEAGGGLLLAAGLLNPLAGALIIGMMISAGVSVHLPKGLWATNGGFELPLVYAAVAAGVAFVGPGAYSLDAALDWSLSGTDWGLGAVGLGVLGGIVALASRATKPALASAGQQEAA